MEDIIFIQFKNKFNYIVRQLKIDYRSKTYQLGIFRIGADKTVNRKVFYEKIEELKKSGFMEVK